MYNRLLYNCSSNTEWLSWSVRAFASKHPCPFIGRSSTQSSELQKIIVCNRWYHGPCGISQKILWDALKKYLSWSTILEPALGSEGPFHLPPRTWYSPQANPKLSFHTGHCQDAHLSISDETLQYWPEKGSSSRLSSPSLDFNPFPLPRRGKTSCFPWVWNSDAVWKADWGVRHWVLWGQRRLPSF